MSKLLMNERPLMVMPSLAVKIGLSEAIFLQQLHYWLEISTNVREGHKWVYNTVQEWQEQFPFWSVSTLRRTIKSLEDKKLVITDNFNTMTIDKTKWYRLNYEKLKEYESDNQSEQTSTQSERSNGQNENTSSHNEHSDSQNEYTGGQSGQAEQSKRTDRVVNLNTPLPESTSKSTSENNYNNNNTQPNEQLIENAFTFFEQNGFGMLGHHIADKIGSWIEDVSEELVLQAMKIAVENGAISWNYVETILRDWSSKKFKSFSDYEAHEFKRAQEKSRQKAQSGRRYGAPVREGMVPEWFKKEKEEPAPVSASPAEMDSQEDIEERRRKLREDLARTSVRQTKGMGREF